MRQRKLIALIAIVFALCMVANVALADNRVEVKVTSEPIPFGAQCSKAGGFSFEWDPNSVLHVGDKIFIDLPTVVVGGGVEKVTTCKQDIDFIVAPVQEGAEAAALDAVTFNTVSGLWSFEVGWGAVNIPGTSQQPANLAAGSTGPFAFANDQAPNPATSIGTIIFWVHAKKGANRITVEVVGNGTDTTSRLVVGDASVAAFILSIFDEKEGDAFNVPGIWKDFDGKADENILEYSVPVDSDDNALCIDVFVTETQTVGGLSTFNASLKSQGFTFDLQDPDADPTPVDPKFTFIPSNPQIAHIGGDLDIKLADCKAANIKVPEGQEGDVDCSFDNQTDGLNQLIVNGDFADDDKYSVKMTITSPSNAYWGETLHTYYRNKTSYKCRKWEANKSLNEAADFSDPKALDATGDEIDADDLADGKDCTVADDQKAVVLTADGISFKPGFSAGLYIPVPTIVFNGVPEEGDKIEIEVVLTKMPCGEINLGTITLGVYGSAGSTLLYPYFTPMAETDSWWDGFVVDNLGDKEGKAIAYAYEADGDQGMIEFTIKGNSQFVTLLSAILGDMTVTEAGGSGVLGDSSLYIKVKTEFDADGFAMMGNGMEAQGYLPRD